MKNPSGKTKAMEEEQTFLSILWVTPSCPSATPAGKTQHPHDLQVSGHAESFQKCLRGRTQPSCQEHRSVTLNSALKSSVQSPHPLPCGRHCKEPCLVFFPKSPNWKSDHLGCSQTSVKSKSRVFASLLLVNFNFCGLFFFKRGVGALQVNISGKRKKQKQTQKTNQSPHMSALPAQRKETQPARCEEQQDLPKRLSNNLGFQKYSASGHSPCSPFSFFIHLHQQ